MNWCQPHWDLLKQGIKDRGLWKFVPEAKEAHENIVEVLEGGEEAFDPLMGAWARINMTMAESPALRGRIMQCPLCVLLEDGRPDLVRNWVDGCLDQAAMYAVEKGLVQKQ